MSYLVQESDGTSKITLEDGSGFLLLDISAITGEGALNVEDMVAMISSNGGDYTCVISENMGDMVAE